LTLGSAEPTVGEMKNRRYELGKILVVESCDPLLIPHTFIVVATTKDAELISGILKVVFPEEMGPPNRVNIDGTLNYSIGTSAMAVSIKTASQHADGSAEKLAEIRTDLGARLAVVYRYFNP